METRNGNLRLDLDDEQKKSLLDRFLRYCRINTRSSDVSETFPSTREQWDLLNLLKRELEELNLSEIELDEKGYLTATLEATKGFENVPVIGFFAHVDTYPGTRADNVNPQVIENYDGKPILLDGGSVVIDENDSPHLLNMIGHTIITTDGKTLLGADDKAGIASIMEMLRFFVNNPHIPHGKIRVAFTPDEETGRGMDYFDVKKFGADIAYTVDGSIIGEIETETFYGDTVTVEVIGYDIHPGLAKGKMKNAIRAASDFITRLPEDRLPESTEKREPYLHPLSISGEVGKVVIKFITRAFTMEELNERNEEIKKIAQETQKSWNGITFNVNVERGYNNMKEVLEKYPKVINLAKEAIRQAGIEPFESYIRGGTDGCRLSFMGLPTPNIFNGALCYHGVKEHISLEWLSKSCETLRHLVILWSKEKSVF